MLRTFQMSLVYLNSLANVAQEFREKVLLGDIFSSLAKNGLTSVSKTK